MSRDEALRILAAHQAELAQMGVKAVFLFGSTARGDARPDSDVDILIDVDRPARPFGFFELFRVKGYFERILGRPVDVGERDAVRPELRDRVYREAIRVA